MLLLPKNIGAFTLTRKLGTGGVAESFAGTSNVAGGRPVVVRRILPYVLRDPARLAAIEARVADLIGVRHPFLVHVMEHTRDGDDHYIIEEHIDGVDLDRVLSWCRQHHTQIPPNVFLNIATQVCNGLEALHGRQGKGTNAEHVLHLALKPGSIFITREGKVMVGSFGLTRSPTTLPQGGVTGPVPARMEYLSPEQTHPDQKLTPASDIFALGAILYELLTLESLFRADSNLQTIHKVRRAEVTSQLMRAKEAMPGLDKILYRALSLNPRHRYQRAFVLREDLRGLMAGYSFATISDDTRTFVAPLLDQIAATAAAPASPAPARPASPRAPDPMTTAALTARALQERADAEREAFPDIREPGESTESMLARENDPPTELGRDEPIPQDRDRPTIPGSDTAAAAAIAGGLGIGLASIEAAGNGEPHPEPTSFDAIPNDPPSTAETAREPRPTGGRSPSSTAAFLHGEIPARPEEPTPRRGIEPSSTAAFMKGEVPDTAEAPTREAAARPSKKPPRVAAPPTSAPALAAAPLAAAPAAPAARVDPPPPERPAATPVEVAEDRQPPPAPAGGFSRAMPGPTLSRPMPGPTLQKPAAPPRPTPVASRPPPAAPPTPTAAAPASAAPVASAGAPPPPDVRSARPSALPAYVPPPATFGDPYSEPEPRRGSGVYFGVAAVAAMGLVLVCAGGGWLGYAWWEGRAAQEAATALTAAAEGASSDAADALADGAPPHLEPLDPDQDAASVLAGLGDAPDAAPPPEPTPDVAEPAPPPEPEPVAAAPDPFADPPRTAPAPEPTPTRSTSPTTSSSSTASRSSGSSSTGSSSTGSTGSSGSSGSTASRSSYDSSSRSTSSSSSASRSSGSSSYGSSASSGSSGSASRSSGASRSASVYEPEVASSSTSYRSTSSGGSSSSRTSTLPDPEPAEPALDVSVTESPVSDLEQYVANAKKGKLSSSEVGELEAFSLNDPQYTRSRALLLMNAQRKNDDKAIRSYLDEIMLLPENRYNPVYLTDQARWYVNHGDYGQAIERAQLAERYWSRLPPELVFTKKAEIYEIQAAAWQGRFYKSGSDLDLLDKAIHDWERYKAHVATRSRSDLRDRADEQLAKLNDIKGRLE